MATRRFVFIASVPLLAAIAATARGDEDGLRKELDAVERRMREMEERHAREMEALRGEMETRRAADRTELSQQIDLLVDQVDDVTQGLASRTAAPALLRLVDVSLNVLTIAGASTASEPEIRFFQAGGHDPKKRGFTFPNAELILSGAVDPYFTAQANVVTLLSPEGETEVELEEAFATTTGLPAGLQIKAGQFFTAFGRHNPEHPHQWEFVDIPVVNGRMLGGDGMRGPGAQVAWLGPVALPVEVTLGLQNANGETMASFLSEEPPVGAPVVRDVETFEDLTRTARLTWSVDADDELPVLLGVSGAWGPSGASRSGDARILGADVSAKWRPVDAHAGFPFVSVRGEWMARRFEFDTPSGTSDLEDSGWYGQAVWGFTRDWTAGLRYDRFSGTQSRTPGLDDRARLSLALTYYTSEYASIRLQVNRERTSSWIDDATSVWLQFEFNLGAHGAHRF